MRWLHEWSAPITVGLLGSVVTVAVWVIFGVTL